MVLRLDKILDTYIQQALNDFSTKSDLKTLAGNVSEILRTKYSLISPQIYTETVKVKLIPGNSEEILRGLLAHSVFGSYDPGIKNKTQSCTLDGPYTYLTLQTVIDVEYSSKGSKTLELGNRLVRSLQTKIELEIKRDAGLGGDLSNNRVPEFRISDVDFNFEDHITRKGTYQRETKPVSVKIPSVPEEVVERGIYAKSAYYDALKESKLKGLTGDLPEPKLYLLFIPGKSDFVEKVKRMDGSGGPHSALVLRVNEIYNHLVAKWDANTKEEDRGDLVQSLLAQSLVVRKPEENIGSLKQSVLAQAPIKEREESTSGWSGPPSKRFKKLDYDDNKTDSDKK